MKFKLINTLQTANSKGFTDEAGNTWQAIAFYNVTLKTIVYLPATVAACKALTVNAMKYKGKPLIDQANYLLWCKRYSITPVEKSASLWAFINEYIAALRMTTAPQPITVRQ